MSPRYDHEVAQLALARLGKPAAPARAGAAGPVSRTAAQRRAVTGAETRARGLAFEREFRAAVDWYRARGLADLHKVEPPMQATGLRDPKTRHMLYRIAGKGPADWDGHVAGVGSLLAETKTVGADDTGFTPDSRKRHQLDSLLRRRECGGRAVLILACPVRGLLWLVEELDTLAAGGRVYLVPPVPGRTRARGPVVVVPHVRRSSAADVAAGRAPWWPFRDLLVAPVPLPPPDHLHLPPSLPYADPRALPGHVRA